MTWQTGLLVGLVVLWAAAQYGLAVHAMRDLRRRPRVRGNNKIVWALVILGVPIAGALVYAVYGPTSFIRRDRPRPAMARGGRTADRDGAARQRARASRPARTTNGTVPKAKPRHRLPEIPDADEPTATVTPSPDLPRMTPLAPQARERQRSG